MPLWVAVGDVDGDGRADILTGPGAGIPGEVHFYDGRTTVLLGSYFPFEKTFLGGVFVSGFVPPPPQVDLLDFTRSANGNVTCTMRGSLPRDLEFHRSTDGGATWTKIEVRAVTGLPQSFNFNSTAPDALFRGVVK